jgi:hypothetical protein
VGCAPGAVARRAMTSNRSSDDDDKVHEQRPFYSNQRPNPLRIRANDCLISQLLRSCIGILWGVQSRVFTSHFSRRASSNHLPYLPTYLPTSGPLRPLYLPLIGFHALPPGSRNLWATSTSLGGQRLLRKRRELASGREKQGRE